MPIVWREAMSVDGGIIDRDHQYLIEIINQFEMVAPDFGAVDQLTSILFKLETYTKRHFRREEELQRSINYPGCDAQRQEHLRLIGELSQI